MAFMRGLAYAVLAATIVVVLSVAVLAADGTAPPWEGIVIEFGGTALVWGGIVAGLIQLGKHIRIGGSALLGTAQAIWLANLILGGLGMFLYSYLNGAGIPAALLQAGLAVLGASGAFEAVATAAGKGSPKSSPG